MAESLAGHILQLLRPGFLLHSFQQRLGWLGRQRYLCDGAESDIRAMGSDRASYHYDFPHRDYVGHRDDSSEPVKRHSPRSYVSPLQHGEMEHARVLLHWLR